MFPGVFYALLAGFLGAVASSSAKLSLGADYLKGVCETGLRTWGEQRKFRHADETTACDRVSLGSVHYPQHSQDIWERAGSGFRGSKSHTISTTDSVTRRAPLAASALSCSVRVLKDDAARAGSRRSVSVSRVADAGGAETM